MIKAYRIDNVYLGIDSDDDGTLLELNDYFSFFVPNYKYQPKFKNGVWDGRIKLFSPWDRQLYIGLLPYLKKFARQYGYELQISPDLFTRQQLSPEEVAEYMDSLHITNELGEVITPRFYQKIGLYHMINAKRKTLVAPTAAGKSLMIYMFARWFLENEEGRLGLVVPTTNLVEQMTSDFADYSQGTFDQNVHRIYSGKEKDDKSKRIYTTTWQSVYDLPEDYFSQFQSIIVDECHGAQAKSLKGLLEKCQAEYRVGTTGTMHEPEAHKWVIEGLLGETEDLVTLAELQRRNMVANLKINCITFNFSNEDKKAAKNLPYPDEIKYIIHHEKRQEKIYKAIGSVDENSFVLFDKVEYGKRLKADLESRFPDRNVYLIYGATKVKEREILRKALANQKGSIVVASYKVFSLGISIKNLHHIFFAEPVGKSSFRIFQSIGRALRLYGTKEFATLWDFWDQLTNSRTTLNHTMRHAVQRVSMYNKYEQQYKIIKVEL